MAKGFSLFCIALASRLVLIYSPVKDWLINRIELSTPLTAWNRVQEGLSLVKHGVSPYSGDVVHETPLVLSVFLGLQQVSEELFPLLFLVGDLLIGWLLYKLASLHSQMLLKDQTLNSKSNKSLEPVLLKPDSLDKIPLLVSSIYLLNPYTIGSCVAHSTVMFTNLAITATLLFSLKGSILLSTLGVAVGTYLSLYPLTLLASVILILMKVRSIDIELSKTTLTFASQVVASFIIWTALLLSMSYHVFNSWDFLTATHGFILQVSDLTPNMGLFWYFFTEMFEHFRIFYLWVFQLNAFFYCIPLTIKLREWSFKKAITIKTYSSYHPVPVPFNLLSIPLMAICRQCEKCVYRRFPESDLDESGRKKALDNLVKKLETSYFETYGYSFPLTEGRKMDHLLHETDGSRRIANQIVRQVFRRPSCKQEKVITGEKAWQSLGIGIDGCLLAYRGPDYCDVCKENEPKGIHSARYLMPFTPEKPRIEVLIQESGERRVIALGTVLENYNCHMMPGWLDGTVGYHVDDGRIFERGCADLGREAEGAMANRGDLITCEVDFDNQRNSSIPILFSLNGKEVARTQMKYTAGQTKLYPFISLGHEGIRVLAKMCPRESSEISSQYSSDTEQWPIRDSERDHELLDHVREQFVSLREEMTAKEQVRIAQARKFEEQLEDQRKMLMDIRNLVLRLNEERQKDERAEETL